MSKKKEIIEYFQKKPGVHPRKELVAAGAYPALLRKLVNAEILEEVCRGFYCMPTHEEQENSELQTIATIFPRGVFCLQSALNFHNIGTQQAFEHHIAILKGNRTPARNELALQVYKFSEKSYLSGIEEYGNIKVYSVAKTIADCFKFRNQIGLDVALEALKDVIRNKRTTIAELLDQAEICRVKKVIMPYLEPLI